MSVLGIEPEDDAMDPAFHLGDNIIYLNNKYGHIHRSLSVGRPGEMARSAKTFWQNGLPICSKFGRSSHMLWNKEFI